MHIIWWHYTIAWSDIAWSPCKRLHCRYLIKKSVGQSWFAIRFRKCWGRGGGTTWVTDACSHPVACMPWWFCCPVLAPGGAQCRECREAKQTAHFLKTGWRGQVRAAASVLLARVSRVSGVCKGIISHSSLLAFPALLRDLYWGEAPFWTWFSRGWACFFAVLGAVEIILRRNIGEAGEHSRLVSTRGQLRNFALPFRSCSALFVNCWREPFISCGLAVTLQEGQFPAGWNLNLQVM